MIVASHPKEGRAGKLSTTLLTIEVKWVHVGSYLIASTPSCNFQNSTETFSNISQETRSPPVENRDYRKKVPVWTQEKDKSVSLSLVPLT